MTINRAQLYWRPGWGWGRIDGPFCLPSQPPALEMKVGPDSGRRRRLNQVPLSGQKSDLQPYATPRPLRPAGWHGESAEAVAQRARRDDDLAKSSPAAWQSLKRSLARPYASAPPLPTCRATQLPRRTAAAQPVEPSSLVAPGAGWRRVHNQLRLAFASDWFSEPPSPSKHYAPVAAGASAHRVSIATHHRHCAAPQSDSAAALPARPQPGSRYMDSLLRVGMRWRATQCPRHPNEANSKPPSDAASAPTPPRSWSRAPDAAGVRDQTKRPVAAAAIRPSKPYSARPAMQGSRMDRAATAPPRSALSGYRSTCTTCQPTAGISCRRRISDWQRAGRRDCSSLTDISDRVRHQTPPAGEHNGCFHHPHDLSVSGKWARAA